VLAAVSAAVPAELVIPLWPKFTELNGAADPLVLPIPAENAWAAIETGVRQTGLGGEISRVSAAELEIFPVSPGSCGAS
jgi:hypothetical protein